LHVLPLCSSVPTFVRAEPGRQPGQEGGQGRPRLHHGSRQAGTRAAQLRGRSTPYRQMPEHRRSAVEDQDSRTLKSSSSARAKLPRPADFETLSGGQGCAPESTAISCRNFSSERYRSIRLSRCVRPASCTRPASRSECVYPRRPRSWRRLSRACVSCSQSGSLTWMPSAARSNAAV
jgi:hypothetical protein